MTRFLLSSRTRETPPCSAFLKPRSARKLTNTSCSAIVSIKDRNGNELTFSESGVQSNRGRKLDFERDRGRITRITDPRGNYLLYEYDAQGDLVRFYDRMNSAAKTNPVQYTYLGAAGGTEYAHYLDTIKDPFGREAVKNQYGPDGRLKQLTDAGGQAIGLDYDTTTLTQTVTDQLGAKAKVQLDDRGNVVREESPTGQITLRTYKPGTNFLTSETQVIGQIDSATNGETNDLTTTYEVNSFGQPTVVTDPQGNKTHHFYDQHGLPTSTIDALSNTTYTTYDDRGNLLSTTDVNRNTTNFGYDAHGNVTSIVTGAGNDPFGGYDGCDPFADPECGQPNSQAVETRFQYNTFGDLVKTISPQDVERTIGYDANGNNEGTSFTWVNPADPNDQRTVATTTVFDANDRSTSNTSPSGVSTTQYDVLDRVVATTDEHGNTSRTTYDKRGLVVQTRTESANEAGQTVWLISRTVYDAAGRAVYATDGFPDGTPEPEITGTHTVYDEAGRVTTTQRLKGLVIDLAGAAGNLSALVAKAGTVISTSITLYDDAGRVRETIDEFGGKSQTLYDRFGQIIETRRQSRDDTLDENEDGVGDLVWLVSRMVYDQYGRVELSTDQFILPEATALGEGASPPVRATRTIYDKQGRTVKAQRLANVVVEIQNGAPVVTAEGTVLSASETIYNDKGQVARTIAADGQFTDQEYDTQGRPIATIRHPLPAEEVGLGAEFPGKLVRLRTVTEYDQYGRRLREWTNLRQVEDSSGNVVHLDDTTAPNARKTEFEYDEHGRLTKTIFNNGTSVSTSYDAHGRAIAETDQLQHVKAFEYDSQGRLTAVVLPAVVHPESALLVHPRYEYGYDAQGNHTLIRDNVMREPDGTIRYDHLAAPGDDVRDTLFTFDAQGRQLSRTLPLGAAQAAALISADQDVRDLAGNSGSFTEGFWYNDRGQAIRHVSFEDVVTVSVYDNTAGAGGRLKEKRFFDNSDQYAGGAGSPSEIWTYAYDGFGRLAEIVQDGDGILATTADQRPTENTYDAEGRLITVATPEGTIHYVFNDLGQHVGTWTGPDEQSVQTKTRYLYDPLGRINRVEVHVRNGQTLSQPEATDYFYDLLGNLDEMHSPGNVVADYQYDDLNRLELLRHFRDENANGTYEAGVDALLAEFYYDLLADGRRSGVTETDDQGQITRIDWLYDDIGRLTRESYNSHDDSLDFIADYVFDLVGNRLEKNTDTDPTFSGNPTFDETIVYAYDPNDRLLTETKQASDPADERHTIYTYGPNATPANGGDHTAQTKKTLFQGLDDQGVKLEETEFRYNLQNRLSAADIDSNGDNFPDTSIAYSYDADGLRVAKTTDGEVLLYLVDHHNPTGYAQVLEELNAFNQLLRSYTLGRDVLTQAESTGEIYSFLYDGHGSTRALLDADATLIAGQTFGYDAYGEALGFDPLNAATAFLYSGEQFDSAIDKHYLRARYYDSHSGRFLSLDPFVGFFASPETLHKYWYANGDPVAFIDPTGLSGVPGDVYLAVGTRVHWMFSIYVFALGLSARPGATLGTLLPDNFPAGSQYQLEKPDLVDLRQKRYFELKPVTWANDSTKQGDLDTQMGKYDNALNPLGFHRGRSSSLTLGLNKMPLGKVLHNGKTYLVSLRPATTTIQPSGIDGRGVLWYELDETRDDDKDKIKHRYIPIPTALAIPQQVADDISVFDYFDEPSPRLESDWVFYASAVASGVAIKYLLATQLTTYAAAGATASGAYATTSLANSTTMTVSFSFSIAV